MRFWSLSQLPAGFTDDGVYYPCDPFPAQRAGRDAPPGNEQLRQPFPATTMLVAIGFVPRFRPVSLALFGVGVVLQLAYSAAKRRALARQAPAGGHHARIVSADGGE